MPDYDFHTISANDFEELTRDLLQARDGVVFQGFKSGVDGGVDIRFATDGENRIVQCKHLRRSGYDKLLREVRKEVAKVAVMKPAPTRYYLVTSVDLTNANKNELAGVLGLEHTEDILGANDLNNLLGLHERVETQHYKLWLASVAVMQRVLHNAAATRSDFQVKRIRNQVRYFVQSKAYDQAKAQLARDRIIILSGLPGVGKTTIADFLLYEKFAEGIQPVLSRDSLEAAAELFQEGVPQIFHYDDFLGETFLGEGGSPFGRNEDRLISDFIEMVVADESKFLILTTREHILSEALIASERLKHSGLGTYRFIVSVGDYTQEQRARILYNHAYFNRLRAPYVEELLRDAFYLKVVAHPKFSPRIIDWLTNSRRLKAECPPGGYQAYCMRLLDNPTEVWRFAYESQISEAARSMLLALHSLEGRSSHERLAVAFAALHAVRAQRYGFTTAPNDLRSALRILGGAFINITRVAIEFFDPSVRDLMNTMVVEAPDNAIDMLAGAVSMTQVRTVWLLARREGNYELKWAMRERATDWEAGLARAVKAPQRIEVDGHMMTYSPGAESRVLLLLEMTAALEVDSIKSKIAPAIDEALEHWRLDAPNLEEALDILGTLRVRPFSLDRELQRQMATMRSQLIVRGGEELEPRDVVELIELDPDRPLSADDLSALGYVARGWIRDSGDLLRNCRSEDELHQLHESLSTIERVLDVDFRSLLNATATEISMFVPDEVDDDFLGQRERETPGDGRIDRRTMGDLFDGLRDMD